MALNNQYKSSEETSNYLKVNEAETLLYQLDNEDFFKFCKTNIKTLSQQMRKGLISNLIPLGQDGYDYLRSITDKLPEDDSEALYSEFINVLNNDPNLKPMDYSVLIQLGYTGVVKAGSPFSAVAASLTEVVMRNRGLKLSDKSKLTMNANEFALYLPSRIELLYMGNGDFYIYKQDGAYIKTTEIVLKKVFRDILHEYKQNIWNRKWEAEYFEAIKRESVCFGELNRYKNLINLKNGMLDIYKMELLPHDPTYHSSIQIPIAYDMYATCPMFMEFLSDIFDNDLERINLVQEIMGYCFLPEIKIQKAFIFFGTGSNGKSVLAEILRHLIGVENTSNVPLNSLGGSFGLQNLPDKLVNISTENEFSKKFNTQNFKMITGGDAVNIEQKYKDSYNAVIIAKLIVLVNRLMDTDDLSNGYYRRLLIIPFDKEYLEKNVNQEEERDINYMDKNLTEKLLSELGGILNFALEGLQRLRDNNYNMTSSTASEAALERYKNRQNPTIDFFNDRVQVDSSARTKSSDFRKEFINWAIRNGFEDFVSIGSTRFWDLFNKTLSDNNVKTERPKIHGEYYVTGIKLTNQINSDSNI